MSTGAEVEVPNPFFVTAPGTGIGAFVVDPFGRRGRIYQAHYGCPENEDWLAQQRIAPSSNTKRWVSILCDQGGAVAFPETDVKPVAPFVLRNDSALLYFGSDDPLSARR